MDHEDEFLNTFFTQVAQLCFDKAKETGERERESCNQIQIGPWGTILLMHLPQIAVAECSYADLGSLNTKNKGFLRKILECETLVQLIKAQVEVQNWRFLPTLITLYGAQTRMSYIVTVNKYYLLYT
ncbi:Uncharacterized protein DBV15_12032 [Temnothorax longispinosus]|uniref:Uncharacterized protein n=1 Tax=Temnothorax longispinosus TaxID=300112 RepID=A0A4V3SB53_9HYME|nr:Uncharacterized protein DBV15_12032 [Temnothorax longispinosus]